MIPEGFAASTIMPDGITPKSAWRAWRIVGNRLTSSNQGMIWEPGVATRAICRALGQGAPGETLMVNVLEQNAAQAIRNHMAQDFSPPIYEVDEGEHRMYFTKKSYLVIPRAVPVRLQVPSVHCSCGLYATSNFEEARGYGPVVGRVALWGHVIIHETGYRGQFGYPQSLYVPDNQLPFFKNALTDYGVPVLGLSEILPRRSKSEEEETTTYPTINFHTTVSDHTNQDEEEEDDPTPGDGVRRLTLRDIRKALTALRGSW